MRTTSALPPSDIVMRGILEQRAEEMIKAKILNVVKEQNVERGFIKVAVILNSAGPTVLSRFHSISVEGYGWCIPES